LRRNLRRRCPDADAEHRHCQNWAPPHRHIRSTRLLLLQPRSPITAGASTGGPCGWRRIPARPIMLQRAAEKLLLVIPEPAEGRSPGSITPAFPYHFDGGCGFRTAAEPVIGPRLARARWRLPE
jgi:hypothetical protein